MPFGVGQKDLHWMLGKCLLLLAWDMGVLLLRILHVDGNVGYSYMFFFLRFLTVACLSLTLYDQCDLSGFS